MARKGILVADPTVSSMTRAQWLFEYHALKHKEDRDTERYVKLLKATLINLLGLNIKSAERHKDLPPAERFEAELTDYTPLVLLAGNHHLLSSFFKEGDPVLGGTDDLTGQSKVDDAEYEKMSQAILDDMEPIEVPIAKMSVDEIHARADNKGLGVRTGDDPPFPLPPGTVIIKDEGD